MATDKTESKQKPWTIMIYLGGDNNLSEEMVFALKSMYEVGTAPRTRVIALYDTVGAVVPFDIGKNLQGTSLKEIEDDFIKSRQEFFEKHKSGLDQKIGKLLREASAAGLDISLQDAQSSAGKIGAAKPDAKEIKKLEARATELQALLDAEEKKYPEYRRFRLSGTVGDLLEGFIVDCVKRDEEQGDPDRHYALILSGHGSGAVGDFLTSDKQAAALGIQSLNTALTQARTRLRKKGRWIDLLGFDSCLMSMSEVAFEVRESVQYMVGSEGFEPNSGWPYDKVLKILYDEQFIEPAQLASNIVMSHVSYYDDYTAADLSVDSSAMNLDHLHALSDALGRKKKTGKESHGLTPALIDALKNDRPVANGSAIKVKEVIRDAIVLAHWDAQGYKDEQYCDLWDFCGRLQVRLQRHEGLESAREIAAACTQVQDAITKIAFNSRYRGAAFQHSHGISIFFPWADIKDSAGVRDLDHYRVLKFPSTTQWAGFLDVYLEETKRKPRAVEEKTTKGEKKRISFLDFRPGLMTGDPASPPDGVRMPWVNFRMPWVNFRMPWVNFRMPWVNFRNSSGSPMGALKISSMKNPPSDWYE